MRSCCWLFVAVAAASAAAQAPAGRVEVLNRQLLHAAGEVARESPTAAARSLQQLIAERAAALAELIESHPKRALELALPDPTLAKLRALAPTAAAGLEQRGR